MTGSDDTSSQRLAALYDRYLEVIPANTPELLDAAHALRYQVYCVEHAFEDPAQQINERERDRYDAHSVHAVLIYRSTDHVVGCVRLILPSVEHGVSTLPIRELLSGEVRERLDRCDPDRTAEISRYAVSKMFRRREGESLYPDVHFDALAAADARRLVPHLSLGLIRGVGRLASEHGITTVCAAMAPALIRLLERFGLAFEPLGPPIEYHGLRQPCIADCETLLASMAQRNSEYHRLVETAYRGA